MPEITGCQRINLLRMLREAVTNALRHGTPDSIQFEIIQRDDQLVLRVSNDGPSSPPEAWKEGAGMADIRSRAAKIDACVEWRSDEVGATFMLSIPLGEEVGDEERALA
ncbi:MAG: ATP-binding protein [Candidatus Thiodiazotropha sp.]